MTTAFAYAVGGRFFSAFHAQPAGLAFAIALLAGGLCCVRVLFTGRYAFMIPRMRAGWLAVWVVAVLLFGWGYKWVMFTA